MFFEQKCFSQGGSICSSNRHEQIFRRTDISLIGLGGCFRTKH